MTKQVAFDLTRTEAIENKSIVDKVGREVFLSIIRRDGLDLAKIITDARIKVSAMIAIRYPVTTREFSKRENISIHTSRRRLNKMVSDGIAKVDTLSIWHKYSLIED